MVVSYFSTIIENLLNYCFIPSFPTTTKFLFKSWDWTYCLDSYSIYCFFKFLLSGFCPCCSTPKKHHGPAIAKSNNMLVFFILLEVLLILTSVTLRWFSLNMASIRLGCFAFLLFCNYSFDGSSFLLVLPFHPCMFIPRFYFGAVRVG